MSSYIPTVFPKFVPEEGSDEVKVILADPESYKMLGSGIQYKDIFSGIKGPSLISKNQKVTISYQLFGQNTELIRCTYFRNTLTDFAEKLDFVEDFTDAMLNMKVTGYRRIIIPPKINNTNEYRIIDVIIQSIKPKKVMELEEVPKEKTPEEAVAEDSESDSSNIKGSMNTMYSKIATSLGIGIVIAYSINVLMGVVRPKKTKRQSQLNSDIRDGIISRTQKTELMQQQAGFTYQVTDDDEGDCISKHQQGCFIYKKSDVVKFIFFQGSPKELAIDLIRGYEKEIESIRPDDERLIEEAIVGIRINETRRITIPPSAAAVSRLGEDTCGLDINEH